ncbi:unnamed protein product [Nyctereutes procyonoides]|uniref:(raccoon dog) hypothetical protein n=1 Tax=Nyctereutes procyonoides TaxID=34880 RepID=A0A811Z423_NYCPR|nr:unnamed protein product [Nyctereutes procyonoides]
MDWSLCLVASTRARWGHQQLYWSHLRKSGKSSHACHVTLNWHSLIWKYSLIMCCHCFYQYVKNIG